MELPVGISDFRKLVEYRNPLTGEPYLYVDKTNFIKEIIGDGSEVIVITRPRRFGKTINMSMLQYFYTAEVKGQSTTGLFDGLEISKNAEAMAVQGSYPVLFISFKDVDGANFEKAMASMSIVIRKAFAQHRYLLKSDKLEDDEKYFIKRFLTREGAFNESEMQESLANLTGYLEKQFGKQVILLIDEYDAPIQKAYSKKYYTEIIDVFRAIFGKLLKENDSLAKAILTGIVRVSRESLFSAVNNLEVYSVIHPKYSNHFGFTEHEVDKLLKTKKLSALKEAKEWYNGYKFGNSVVYNPWSIIKFIKDEGELKSYWINTSSNRLAEELLLKSSPSTREKIEILMAEQSIVALVDEHVVFKNLDKDESALWSLLLASGYLMSTSKSAEGRYYRCELRIPNKEVLDFYCSTVKVWISSAGGITWFEDFVAALISGKAQSIEKKIQDIIDNTMSYHDSAKDIQESFFHGLMLGIVVGLKDDYIIKSNRESGLGRYDVALFPKNKNNKNKTGIIMEFKAKDVKDTQVKKLASEAIKQLASQNYTRELKDLGINNIISLGIGFTKNKVCVLEAK